MSTKSSKTVTRCAWAQNDPLMQAYHDEEWGVPEYDSRALWEKLMLDGFQAGLSWSIILRKRDAFRKAFKNFEPKVVARFDEQDIERLLQDAGIVRSRAKIEATIGGARAYLAMESEGLDFSKWVWTLAGGEPIQNTGPVPTQTALSETFSKELKKRGFKFVGPVIVYAWMQAVGIVNDHSASCFRRKAPRGKTAKAPMKKRRARKSSAKGGVGLRSSAERRSDGTFERLRVGARDVTSLERKRSDKPDSGGTTSRNICFD